MRPIERIPLDLIDSSPFNVRQQIDTVSLTKSVIEAGQIVPLRLRPIGDRYQIRSGERRFNALKQAGATHAEAIIVEGSDEEVINEQWAENEERAAYTDYERALKLSQMLDALGLTQTELAERVGKSQGWVAQQLRILKLDEIITPVIIQKMTEYQVRAILAAPEVDRSALVQYVEVYLEERGKIPPASTLEEYARELASAREFEKSRRRLLDENEEAGTAGESTSSSNELEVNAEEAKAYIEEYRRDLRPLLKEKPATAAPVIAFITEIIGGPVEELQAKVMEEHGLNEDEAQVALQAYRESYPDIWARCYKQPSEEEEPLTAEQYVTDVLHHNPEVKHADLIKATVEMFDDVTEPYIQGLIDRSRKRRDIYATKSPTTLCPLCGRGNAEKNRILMVLEEHQATRSGVTLVDWLREVLA